ncbi:MAG: hypothetical protein JKY48_03365 [Flavobacteriales bacterium]|nr:hypothetical protein [Flavobacteriales bacterium]
MTATTPLSNYPSFAERFPTFAIDVTNDSYSIIVQIDQEVQFPIPEGSRFFRAASSGGIEIMAGLETTPATGAYTTLQQGLFEINPGMRHIPEGSSVIFVRNVNTASSTIVNVTFYTG